MQQNVGLKISRPGFNVNTAKDYELIFNSSWPALAVAYTTTTSLVAYNSSTTISHALGIYPFTMVWLIDANGNCLGRINTSGITGIDQQNIYLTNNNSDFAQAVSFHIKCFNTDISKDFSYPYSAPPASPTSYDPNFGIKIAKGNKKVTSTDLRDFILHSRAQSPNILAVITESQAKANYSDGNVSNNGFNTLVFQNPQGYQAWVFGYAMPNGTSQYVPVAVFPQSPPGITFFGANYYLTFSQASGYRASMVLLRDPLFAGTNVSVTY